MDEIVIYGMALVPIIMGLIELLKRVGIPKRYTPLFAVLIGILCGFYYIAPDDPKKAVLLGIVLGLSSIGLYSGTKNTYEGFRENENQRSLKA
ncbi:MAG: hypothetical protein ACOX7L_04620 [Dethiobacteria bacterium]